MTTITKKRVEELIKALEDTHISGVWLNGLDEEYDDLLALLDEKEQELADTRIKVVFPLAADFVKKSSLKEIVDYLKSAVADIDVAWHKMLLKMIHDKEKEEK